ncbi:MAG: sulfur oxidation c-type cytochrome SoxX [Gammaproteobacteria bacterium]|nr:MAG: sulfur oxidation c-type cytochrome SoxX [Gammaproteobacteria bacterium]
MLATAILFGTLMLGSTTASAATASEIAAGKELAFDRKKGNCLACHAIEGGSLPGNIGPPLIHMRARFKNPAVLRAQIWDASANNPNTIMPPFGRHNMLSDAEIDKIVTFIHSL